MVRCAALCALLAAAGCHRTRPEGAPIEPGSYTAAVHVGLKAKRVLRADEQLKLELEVGDGPAGECVIERAESSDCRFEIAIDQPTSLAVRLTDLTGDARLARPEKWRTGKIMTMVTNGDIAGATIVLEVAPTWWDANGWKLAALGLGALAVATTLLLRARARVRRT